MLGITEERLYLTKIRLSKFKAGSYGTRFFIAKFQFFARF